jgi:hypothetical protein
VNGYSDRCRKLRIARSKHHSALFNDERPADALPAIKTEGDGPTAVPEVRLTIDAAARAEGERVDFKSALHCVTHVDSDDWLREIRAVGEVVFRQHVDH